MLRRLDQFSELGPQARERLNRVCGARATAPGRDEISKVFCVAVVIQLVLCRASSARVLHIDVHGVRF